MMLDWNEYQKQLGARIGELAKLSPDTLRGYQTLSAANSKTGKLDKRLANLFRWLSPSRLVATAASYSTRKPRSRQAPRGKKSPKPSA